MRVQAAADPRIQRYFFGRSSALWMESPTKAAVYTPTRLGHRPKCAVNALERFAEFPRQERLDSLRPHLVKYELFPPRRDPETAPITMRELKGLVRIWKLHNERNFWRNNSTKDAIVLALHQHVQKKNQLEKLKEEIVAKGRQKREEFSVNSKTSLFASSQVSYNGSHATAGSRMQKSHITAAIFALQQCETSFNDEEDDEEDDEKPRYVPLHERTPALS